MWFIILVRGIFFLLFIKLVMTSFTLILISVKESFHDFFKKTLNITPVNITSFTVPLKYVNNQIKSFRKFQLLYRHTLHHVAIYLGTRHSKERKRLFFFFFFVPKAATTVGIFAGIYSMGMPVP